MTSYYEKFVRDYKNKRVLIMGLGLLGGGLGVCEFLVKAGARVTVTDLRQDHEFGDYLKILKAWGVDCYFGEHPERLFWENEVIVRNPAVARDSKFLAIASRAGAEIVMKESWLARYFDGQVVGVTGTRGKTTTAYFIYELLKLAGRHVFLTGNVPGSSALPILEKLRSDSIVVMELSSWALQGFDDEKISPHIAVFTNFYEDHLNRYSSMEAYFKDKTLIYKYQGPEDFLVVNKDNDWLRQADLDVRSKKVWFSSRDLPESWHLKIKGDHNRQNAAAALAVGEILKIDLDMIRRALTTFDGVEYRQQEVLEVNGVRFVNDSTSTTPIATIKALESIKGNIALLLGGADKNLDMEELARAVVGRVTSVVFLKGGATHRLRRLIEQYGGKGLIKGEYSNFYQAVRAAYSTIETNGGTVLLSPGCASFGMFANEFDRGVKFNQIAGLIKQDYDKKKKTVKKKA